MLLTATASTALGAAVPEQRTACPDYCKGTTYADAQYLCGDWRLGPVNLPTMIPINVTTIGYDRFGGLCPGAFLFTWYNQVWSLSAIRDPRSSSFIN